MGRRLLYLRVRYDRKGGGGAEARANISSAPAKDDAVECEWTSGRRELYALRSANTARTTLAAEDTRALRTIHVPPHAVSVHSFIYSLSTGRTRPSPGPKDPATDEA